MTERTPKVGDVVAWADVPDGALVKSHRQDGFYALRIQDRGCWVGVAGEPWWQWQWSDEKSWPWRWEREGVTIVALHLTGQETAADLRRLAEVFEVWECLVKHPRGDLARWAARAGYHNLHRLAERLRAANWRPGMTAEDAARLLTRPPEREPVCSVCGCDFAWNEEADRRDEGPLFCNSCAHAGAARLLAEGSGTR
jgi:hypothetical protein